MPDLTVVVSATGTELGKTWLTAHLARLLGEGDVSVSVRKPVQSFGQTDSATDADILARASGEDTTLVCPKHRRYEMALAPPMAADFLGRPRIVLGDLVDELSLPDRGVALIEGVGGPRSPLAHDGDTVALAGALDCDIVVVVTTPELGTINATLLSTEAFGGRPVVVFLNRFDPTNRVHSMNLSWLLGLKLEIFTSPQDLASWLNDRLIVEAT